MKTILRIARLELENLLKKKATWILTVAYTLFIFVLCFSDDFRQSYFSTMESLPVELNNFILPIVLISILISVISPVFADDKEQETYQIPATCLVGSKGRSIAKMIGAIIFSITIVLLLEVITLVICGCFGLCDTEILIKYVDAEIALSPVWTALLHFLLSTVTLVVGCIILTVIILFISCSMQNTQSAISLSGIIVLIEFIINKFSFPTLMQEYNIWIFFRPYYLFITELINFSPFKNLLLYTFYFLPLCVVVTKQIIRNGGNLPK